MNTPLYRTVHLKAVELLKAAEADNDASFDELYGQLKKLCFDNEGNAELNHPVQWETLADFTEDQQPALDYYQRALALAEASGAKDYTASVAFSMASIYEQRNDNDQAWLMAQKAAQAATGSIDSELKADINKLLTALKARHNSAN